MDCNGFFWFQFPLANGCAIFVRFLLSLLSSEPVCGCGTYNPNRRPVSTPVRSPVRQPNRSPVRRPVSSNWQNRRDEEGDVYEGDAGEEFEAELQEAEGVFE
jgi:hypothetical protein